jgi:hypothetical protein
MPSRFPRFEDGDPLEPWIINMILDELERLGQLSGSGLIGVDNASGDGPPTIVDYRDDGGAILPAQLTSTLAAGTIVAPTTGTMTLLAATGTGGALTTTGGTPGVTVRNTLNFSATLASGTHIWVAYYSGAYYLIQASC